MPCFAVCLLTGLVFGAGSALAGQTHVLLETFGSVAQPTFNRPASAAVDQATGDLLVIEAGAGRISRYHSDGTPANFSALSSTNFIDGQPGEADATAQGGLHFADDGFDSLYSQIAIDNSGTATDGDFYITQDKARGGGVQAVDIFARSGEYLGQITGGSSSSFHEVEGVGISPCGVAVDSSGDLYVGGAEEEEIYKYDPTANPPTNTDQVAAFPFTEPCHLAAGVGPSTGSLLVSAFVNGGVYKLDAAAGDILYQIDSYGARQIAIDPANGDLLIPPVAGGSPHFGEFDVSGDSGAKQLSSFAAPPVIAFDGTSDLLYGGESGPSANFRTYTSLVPLPDLTTGPPAAIGETTVTLTGTVKTSGKELTECRFEYGLTTAYGSTVPCTESPAQIGTGTAEVHAPLSGLAAATVYHYRLRAANEYGQAEFPGADRSVETVAPPEILLSGAEDVTAHTATLKAQINPHSADTTYRFEWGLSGAPYEHVTSDLPIGSEPAPKTVTQRLQGLSTGTPYHYRVIAESHCRPETAPGEVCARQAPDHVFTTYLPSPPPETDCPNQALRYGASALLPDCRAYEMVSPVDKEGANIQIVRNSEMPTQASPDGERFTYANAFEPVFAGQPSSKVLDQYLATRGADGWTDRGINAPLGRQLQAGGDISYPATETAAFSDDLCSEWISDYNYTPLTADAQQGFTNLYRQDLCGPGGFEALSTASPPEGASQAYFETRSLQGFSSDGTRAFFTAMTALTPEALPGAETVSQIYEHLAGGGLHLVSVLPGGSPAPGKASSGAQVGGGYTDVSFGNLARAVSADGSRVYWTSHVLAGVGDLYLRTHPEQGVVAGECSKPSKPCTVPVGSGSERSFWTATPDGSHALYSEGPLASSGEGQATLYRFDAATEAHTQIAEHVRGVLGASEDLSRVYFISTDPLTGASENEAGQRAEAGQPNLYLDQEGIFTFIGVLAEDDQTSNAYKLGSVDPAYNVARVNPNGSRLLFGSRAQLTGFDNTDAATGKPDTELFAYAAGGALRCVSCAASGELPHGAELGVGHTGNHSSGVWGAAWIPADSNPHYAPKVLSADGSRLFFNSLTPLLSRDTNGAQDIYEWEAPGTGRCTTEKPAYHAFNGGCLYLISSGESPTASVFIDASAAGRDVFFTTEAGLLPQDPGLVDLYDARAEGGFPQPTEAAACEGEACQSPPAPPNDPTPASSSFEGAGNVPPPLRCHKGKVRRKGRCAAKKHKHANGRHRANPNRRTHR
jgi:hypothetical protein